MEDYATSLGIVLSGSTTTNVPIQLTEYGEEILEEGMLVLVRGRKDFLVRIESIFPKSELYRPESPIAEAHRSGLRIDFTDQIDRRITLAEGYILGVITEGSGLVDPRIPPEPGDQVFLFDPKRDVKRVFGVEPGDPGIIWWGSLLGYKEFPVPLNIENITMHLGVFGNTGSGKSYALGILLEKLSSIPTIIDGKKFEVALPAIVIDANADYLDYHNHFNRHGKFGAYYKVLRLVFSNSPHRYEKNTNVITINLNEFTPREIAEFIMAFKSGGIGEVSELQVSGLERVLSDLIEEENEDVTNLLINKPDRIKEKLDELSRGKEAIIWPATARAIRTAIDKFYNEIVKKLNLLSQNPSISSDKIDELVNKPSIWIIDYSPEGAPGISLPVKQLVIGYLARLLYKKFTEYKLHGEEKYLLFLIEEAQNYIPSRQYPVQATVARDYLSLIATQGRKFGLCLGLISQRPGFIDPVVLSMLNTYIIFRISPEDLSYVIKVSGGLPETIKSKLTRLSRGTAIITGQMNLLGLPVMVRTGKRTVEHRMGTTQLVKSLTKTYKKLIEHGDR